MAAATDDVVVMEDTTSGCCCLLRKSRGAAPAAKAPSMPAKPSRRSALRRDRHATVARLKSICEAHLPRPSGARGRAYDFDASTRDNHTTSSGDQGHGELSPAFAAIRAGLDRSFHGEYTLAGQLVQDRLIEAVLHVGEPQMKPWVVFTAGAMGAGKSRTMSWMAANGVFPLDRVVQIDADLFKTALPEWGEYVARDPLRAGFATRHESGYLVEIATEAAMRAQRHIWVDGSLRDGRWYEGVFRKMRAVHPR